MEEWRKETEKCLNRFVKSSPGKLITIDIFEV